MNIDPSTVINFFEILFSYLLFWSIFSSFMFLLLDLNVTKTLLSTPNIIMSHSFFKLLITFQYSQSHNSFCYNFFNRKVTYWENTFRRHYKSCTYRSRIQIIPITLLSTANLLLVLPVISEVGDVMPSLYGNDMERLNSHTKTRIVSQGCFASNPPSSKKENPVSQNQIKTMGPFPKNTLRILNIISISFFSTLLFHHSAFSLPLQCSLERVLEPFFKAQGLEITLTQGVFFLFFVFVILIINSVAIIRSL